MRSGLRCGGGDDLLRRRIGRKEIHQGCVVEVHFSVGCNNSLWTLNAALSTYGQSSKFRQVTSIFLRRWRDKFPNRNINVTGKKNHHSQLSIFWSRLKPKKKQEYSIAELLSSDVYMWACLRVCENIPLLFLNIHLSFQWIFKLVLRVSFYIQTEFQDSFYIMCNLKTVVSDLMLATDTVIFHQADKFYFFFF